MTTNADAKTLPEIIITMTNVSNLPWSPKVSRYDMRTERDINPNINDPVIEYSWEPIKGPVYGHFIKFMWACDLVNFSCFIGKDKRMGIKRYKIVGFLDKDKMGIMRITSYVSKMSKEDNGWFVQTLNGNIYSLGEDTTPVGYSN